MNKKKILYFALMFLPLLITVIALPFLPEQIPAHYNFAGEVDRIGSKFEMLIFPLCTIGMGSFMLWMAKLPQNRRKTETTTRKLFFIPEWEFLFGSP